MKELPTPITPYQLVAAAASERMFVQDLLLSGRTAQFAERGYEALNAALQDMLVNGLIMVEEGRLKLGVLVKVDILETALRKGDVKAWELVDLYPSMSRKYDPNLELLSEIGLRGEELVIEEYKKILPEALWGRIVHVSLTNDSAGFDLQVPMTRDPNTNIQIEVKSSIRPGRDFEFCLSRNEARKAVSLANWYLVLVDLSGVEKVLGHLEGESLKAYLPIDSDERFRWQSVQGRFSGDDLRFGIPT